MTVQNKKSGTEVAQCGIEKIRHVGKSHVDYWTPRLAKRTYERDGKIIEIPEWQVRIAYLGKREWFNCGTANKAAAAEKARKIHLSLISKGWQATLDEFKPAMQVIYPVKAFYKSPSHIVRPNPCLTSQKGAESLKTRI